MLDHHTYPDHDLLLEIMRESQLCVLIYEHIEDSVRRPYTLTISY